MRKKDRKKRWQSTLLDKFQVLAVIHRKVWNSKLNYVEGSSHPTVRKPVVAEKTPQ